MQVIQVNSFLWLIQAKKRTKGLTHFESYAILHGSSLSMCTAVVLVDGEEETVSTAITCTQCDLQAATLRERV